MVQCYLSYNFDSNVFKNFSKLLNFGVPSGFCLVRAMTDWSNSFPFFCYCLFEPKQYSLFCPFPDTVLFPIHPILIGYIALYR